MTAWLTDTLIYTALLIGFVLLVRRPAARFFGPQFAYLLWALPFLRLLLPPIVLPASLAPEPELAAPIAAEWVEVPVSELAPIAAPAGIRSAPAPWDWELTAEVALSVWLGIALAFLGWRVVTYRRMRRELLADARLVGEAGKIRLVETPEVTAPVAFGVFDKVVALPPCFMAQPDIAARDLAIAHELAHHRGHDLLANFAAQALLAMHWFNPLAWMGWRAMRRDQEAACDARVLAGRGRDERARYALLIAGAAAGPRLALAAPMACPVLGDKSIIHRLRSLSMSDTTPRRRWLGRSLIAAGALALPLTASFSYAAGAQDVSPPPAPPAPAPLTEVDPSAAPAEPEAPEAAEAPGAEVRTVIVNRQRGEGDQAEPQVRQFTMRRGGPDLAPLPEFPRMEFREFGKIDPDDPEFRARLEAWQVEMDKWRAEMAERWGPEQRDRMMALGEAARRNAPLVVESCDEGNQGVSRSTTDDGRQRIVICQKRINAGARSGLRQAREAIARNREMSDEVRREVLRDLDQEIERIEREGD